MAGPRRYPHPLGWNLPLGINARRACPTLPASGVALGVRWWGWLQWSAPCGAFYGGLCAQRPLHGLPHLAPFSHRSGAATVASDRVATRRHRHREPTRCHRGPGFRLPALSTGHRGARKVIGGCRGDRLGWEWLTRAGAGYDRRAWRGRRNHQPRIWHHHGQGIPGEGCAKTRTDRKFG
jgi:hypothetical protein